LKTGTIRNGGTDSSHLPFTLMYGTFLTRKMYRREALQPLHIWDASNFTDLQIDRIASFDPARQTKRARLPIAGPAGGVTANGPPPAAYKRHPSSFPLN